MNANSVNAYFSRKGIPLKIRSGGSYYYWTDSSGNLVDVPSVYVYRASQISIEEWASIAADVLLAIKNYSEK